MAKNKLSIYLFKDGISVEDAIHKSMYHGKEEIDEGTFYWRKIKDKPSWVSDFFDNRILSGKELEFTRIDAVYIKELNLTKVGTRVFAVCFGNGRFMLEQSKLEDNFGLKVALNAVNPEQIRSTDTTRLESIPIHSRLQSSKLMDIDLFRMNSEKEMLKAIVGWCKDAEFSTSVTGRESLYISNEAKVGDTFDSLMEEAFSYYTSQDYKDRFEWTEKIKPEIDNKIIDHLNASLITKLNDDNFDDIWTGLPEIVDWESIKGFKIGDSAPLISDLNLEDVICNLRFKDDLSGKYKEKIPSIGRLRNRKIYALAADDSIIGRWSILDCVYAEMTYNKSLYLLINGKWYEIASSFIAEVNKVYDEIDENTTINFINANLDESEDKYNERLQKSITEAILMDKKFIYHGGNGSKFELCDVLTKQGQMIHIKKYKSSSMLSHLFNQGYDVGELLASDSLFRKRANQQIEKCVKKESKKYSDYKFPESTKNFNAKDYEIVYGIITEKSGAKPHIPFFSKIALKHIYKTLTAFGYTVTIKNVLTPKKPKVKKAP